MNVFLFFLFHVIIIIVIFLVFLASFLYQIAGNMFFYSKNNRQRSTGIINEPTAIASVVAYGKDDPNYKIYVNDF